MDIDLGGLAPEEALQALIRTGIKYGLEHFRVLLEELENPQGALPWVHIAGTNGKGSVSALTESILRAHGLSTVFFSSPHLSHPRERWRLDGAPVSRADFDLAFAPIQARAQAWIERGEDPPTFFEACAALAFQLGRLHRSRSSNAIGIAEVGLGGRLDATNLLAPAVTAITSIGLDHTKTLGDSLAQIASEKAGIFKPGIPAIVPRQVPEAQAAIEAVAKRQGSPLIVLEGEPEVRELCARGTEFETPIGSLPARVYRTRLLGPHQAQNARLALEISRELLANQGLAFEPERAQAGLEAVAWPGRFEVTEDPDRGLTVLFDAVHNPHGMQAFTRTLRQVFPGVQATVVFGSCSDKNLEGLFLPLREHCEAIVFTQAHVTRAKDPELLRAEFTRLAPGIPAEAIGDPGTALRRAQELSQNGSKHLFVCGSLYLLGDLFALGSGGQPVLRAELPETTLRFPG